MACNQHLNLTQQLDIGVRGINWDTHRKPGDSNIHLCHTDCRILDAGLLIDAMKELSNWMNAHPTEIVVIIFENVGNWSPKALAAVFKQVGKSLLSTTVNDILGTDKLVYYKGFNDPWPTLGEMIKSNKRLVVLSSPLSKDPSIPWIMDEFMWGFETPFVYSSPNQFTCNIDRPKTPLGVELKNRLYMANHFLGSYFEGIQALLVPSPNKTAEVNTKESILAHASMCEQENQQQRPTLIALDFVDLGNPLEAIAALNSQNIGPFEQGNPVGKQTFPPPGMFASAVAGQANSGVQASAQSATASQVQQAIQESKTISKNGGKFSFGFSLSRAGCELQSSFLNLFMLLGFVLMALVGGEVF